MSRIVYILTDPKDSNPYCAIHYTDDLKSNTCKSTLSRVELYLTRDKNIVTCKKCRNYLRLDRPVEMLQKSENKSQEGVDFLR